MVASVALKQSFGLLFRLVWLFFLAALLPSIVWSQAPDQVREAHKQTFEAPGTQADDVHIQPKTKLDTHLPPIRVDVDLVLVPVTVTDTKNHIVTGLTKDNFAIYENGVERKIQQFSSEEGPISLGLVLDFSKSMTNKVEIQRAAVEAFFQNANSEDEYFVVTVSNHPRLVAAATQSLHTIESALGEITPDGSTALLDAIYLAADQMRYAHYPRHALLIISDGGDNNSRYRLKETKDMIQESEIEAYAIGLFDTALFKTYEEFMGKRWLGELTDVTGGRTVTVDNLAQLPETAAAISQELRSQYVLGFKPDAIAGHNRRRKIKVRLLTDGTVPKLQPYYRKEYSISDR